MTNTDISKAALESLRKRAGEARRAATEVETRLQVAQEEKEKSLAIAKEELGVEPGKIGEKYEELKLELKGAMDELEEDLRKMESLTESKTDGA